ncbi:hypothetical protein OH76DRAFT_1487051 [Lentinus brumalis]|uniref:Uncharacterized protein n=1 Tax=Lentinus brumalis TaxID=2498619 RepID=A0A371CVZ3_9APHY|nr:hypothetical protein OH76DRAFT_1487051 [Polyporus brumalis]
MHDTAPDNQHFEHWAAGERNRDAIPQYAHRLSLSICAVHLAVARSATRPPPASLHLALCPDASAPLVRCGPATARILTTSSPGSEPSVRAEGSSHLQLARVCTSAASVSLTSYRAGALRDYWESGTTLTRLVHPCRVRTNAVRSRAGWSLERNTLVFLGQSPGRMRHSAPSSGGCCLRALGQPQSACWGARSNGTFSVADSFLAAVNVPGLRTSPFC